MHAQMYADTGFAIYTRSQWTQFDALKLSVGLDCARVASCFLRIRCENLVSGPPSQQRNQALFSQSALNKLNIGGPNLSESIGQFVAMTGLLSVNASAVAIAFMACVECALKNAPRSADVQAPHTLLTGDENVNTANDGSSALFKKPANVYNSSVNWLQAKMFSSRPQLASQTHTSPQSTAHIQSLINQISENLVCVLHALAVTCEHEELKKWRIEFTRLEDANTVGRARKHGNVHEYSQLRGQSSQIGAEVAKCVLMAESLPNHSFIRTVARWVRDTIEQ
jgi:hypothetical protein